MPRRLFAVLLAIAGISILGTATAGAVTPAFELDVDPEEGSAIITVRFLQPVPDGFESSGVQQRLVGVFQPMGSMINDAPFPKRVSVR